MVPSTPHSQDFEVKQYKRFSLALHTQHFTTDSSQFRFVLLSLWSCTSHRLSPSLTQHHWVCAILQYIRTRPFIGKLLGKHCHREGRIVSFGSQSGLLQKIVLQNKRISLVLQKQKIENAQKMTQQLQFCVNNSF